MELRSIGSLSVSAAGLGCNNFGWRIDADATTRVVEAALDAGITFFDTADTYGDGRSEEYLGRALGARRTDVVIATKFGHPRSIFGAGARPGHVRRCVEGSLRRLGTDYIDLYQLHYPDPGTPIAETLGALNELVHAGIVREIGCSQFSVEQIGEAEAASARLGLARFASAQNEYSLLHREPERGLLALCERAGMAFLPFFPLASGLLTGKYRRGTPAPAGTRVHDEARYAALLTEQNLDVVERLVAYAEPRGHTVLELAFAWLLAHPAVASVIAGATRPDQVRANAAAAHWRLTAAERAAVDAIAAPTSAA